MARSSPLGLVVGVRWSRGLAAAVLGVGVLGLIPGAGPAVAQTAGHSEDDVKAAFLYNFGKFVRWPDEHTGSDAFVIGVFGDDVLSQRLSTAVDGRSIGGAPLLVQRIETLADISTCRILFIGETEAFRVEEVIAAARGSHVLTVSDIDRFVRRGGMIGFFLDQGNRVKFEINRDAAEREGLRVSTQLLRLARVVDPEMDGVER